ncbi:aromatic ring-hydroxylating oxygenase subunit alpha [Streptomyces atriruber]|uniref:aromatic ring-hydroxylating oxygenase subunit alpha n=1 Tax=Streptomyces atriruber TaxID=545121 RepID=UPI0006E3E6DC|nr:aromatic ring-hydroxylating dioxygenase subunit alpha [Streptomyces atriruber]
MSSWTRSRYTGQAEFDDERRAIFEKSWMCVGHSSALPKTGSFLRAEVGGESVLIVRGKNGNLRAMLNLCRHRGALLCVDERGELGKSIRCEYHGWTYDLDGRLVGAPYINDLPRELKEDRDLYSAAVDIWNGFVWVNLDVHAAPLTDQLDPLVHARFEGVDVLSRYSLADLQVVHTISYDVGANWKMVYENFCECYHCPSMHPELCATVPQFRSGYGTVGGPVAEGAHLADGATGFSLSGQSTAAPLPGLPDDEDPMFYGLLLWPSVSLNLTSDHALCMRIEPRSPGRTRVVADWLYHPDAIADPAFDPTDAVKLFDITNRQDWEAIERVQLGAKSARFEQVYSPHEHLVGSFHQWVDDALHRTATASSEGSAK